MKKLLFVLTLITSLNTFSIELSMPALENYQYDSICSIYKKKNKSKYEGMCTIHRTVGAGAKSVVFYSLTASSSEVDFNKKIYEITIYDNNYTLVGKDTPALLKKTGKRLVVTTKDGDMFIFNEE